MIVRLAATTISTLDVLFFLGGIDECELGSTEWKAEQIHSGRFYKLLPLVYHPPLMTPPKSLK